MCGICGIIDYNKNSSIEETTLRRMCSALKHRGPDDEGVYINNGLPSVGLGHRRLSIIDLSYAGHQPMSNEDGTILIVFNGEIYNFGEHRRLLEDKGHYFKSNTDTEVIIHLYEEYGEDCIKYLRGMFAFAVWDENKKSLLLARDRLGKKPLLYYYKNGKFCFASEFSAILASSLISKEINYDAINYYLTLGYIPAPLTIHKDVFKLPPAHYLVLKERELTISQYWQLDYTRKLDISEEDAKEEILRLIRESVRIRMRSDVPLGAFLSGGLDSGTIVAIMSELAHKVNTFSIGFGEGGYDELNYAKKISLRYQTNHHEFIVEPKAIELLPMLVEHYGEPYADSSCIPTYYVSKLTRQYVTVALNGDGGDEIFAGYERYVAILLSESYKRAPSFIKKCLNSIIKVFPAKEEPKDAVKRLKRFFSGTALPLLERYLYWVGIFSGQQKDELLSGEFKNKLTLDLQESLKALWDRSANTTIIDRFLYLDTLTYLPGDLLVKVDIASMANSLEVRSPLLDHCLVEFAASLPADYKLRRTIKKYIFKKAVKNLLPKDNIHRRKMGFGMPICKWLRTGMKDYLQSNLLSSKCLERGYFNKDIVKELVKEHINGKKDYSAPLWALLILELWHQKFID